MSLRTRLTLLLVATPFATSVAQTGGVEGTVVNSQTGAPVPQAVVTLAGALWSTQTNENGYFMIQGIPVGVYDVHVEATGFASAGQPSFRVNAGAATRLDFRLEPGTARGEPPVDTVSRVFVLQPGLGVGASVGVDGFGGGPNRSLQNGPGFEIFFRVGTRQGLFVHAGGHFSSHGIGQAIPPYHLAATYLEPRFVALYISSRWAPFVMGRVGRTWEIVEGPTVKITASGHSVGGGGGVALRLAPQVAMETGILLKKMMFGAYTFRGDAAWRGCLERLEAGTPLPETIVRCSGSRSPGGVAVFCYPPYFPKIGNNCDPPHIPYPNSERSATRFRVWIGVNLSFAKPGVRR